MDAIDAAFGGSGTSGTTSGGYSTDALAQLVIQGMQAKQQQQTDTYSPFMGWRPARAQAGTNNRYLREQWRIAPQNKREAQFVTAQQHEATFLRKWGSDPKWGVRFVTAAMRSGLPNMSDSARGFDYMNAWKTAGELSDYFSKLGRPMTPMQALEFLGGGRAKGIDFGGSGGGGGGGGGGYSGPRTVTNTSVNLSDGKTAKALTNAILSAFLGREATAEEVRQYRDALNAEERSNPTVTTTTISASGASQSSTTKGGLDSAGKEQVLKDMALGTAEGQAYRTNDIFNKAMQYLAGM